MVSMKSALGRFSFFALVVICGQAAKPDSVPKIDLKASEPRRVGCRARCLSSTGTRGPLEPLPEPSS